MEFKRIAASFAVTAGNSCVFPAPKPGSGKPNPFKSEYNCITADPKFADAANGDFTLKMGSPCKNAGIFENWMADAFDLAGNVRVYADVPDIGCYELKYPMGMVISFR